MIRAGAAFGRLRVARSISTAWRAIAISFGPKRRRDLMRTQFGGWKPANWLRPRYNNKRIGLTEIPGKKLWRGGVKTGRASLFRTFFRAVSTSRRRSGHRRIKTGWL